MMLYLTRQSYLCIHPCHGIEHMQMCFNTLYGFYSKMYGVYIYRDKKTFKDYYPIVLLTCSLGIQIHLQYNIQKQCPMRHSTVESMKVQY